MKVKVIKKTKRVKRIAYDIRWCVDEDENYEESVEDVIASLPAEIEIPMHVSDSEIADYLSDETGFLHDGFRLKKVR